MNGARLRRACPRGLGPRLREDEVTHAAVPRLRHFGVNPLVLMILFQVWV